MDVEFLDLCLSCGSHVADGTAYCSSRCRSLDQSPHADVYNVPSSSRQYSHPSASSSSSRRPRHSAEYYYLPSTSYEVSPAHKLARIEEWAKGVWGHSGEDEVAVAAERKHTPHCTKTKSKSKSQSPRPRFTLTAQHLAPPAMSITTSATSSREDDLSSVHTPSTSSSPSPSPKHLDVVDPWISSPPYEFAYNHFFAKKGQESRQERGRSLVRV